jgi:flagellar hook-basal body complex protein FliE
MDMTSALAAQNYAKTRDVASPEPKAAEGLAGMAENFASVLARGEATAKSAMTGGADAHALVQALASAETAVQTVVTVRDKVVEAYQEILRMPV